MNPWILDSSGDCPPDGSAVPSPDCSVASVARRFTAFQESISPVAGDETETVSASSDRNGDSRPPSREDRLTGAAMTRRSAWSGSPSASRVTRNTFSRACPGRSSEGGRSVS